MLNNTVKEEEQLLQDASTLLMFANVAAKQQQEQQQHQHEQHHHQHQQPPKLPPPSEQLPPPPPHILSSAPLVLPSVIAGQQPTYTRPNIVKNEPPTIPFQTAPSQQPAPPHLQSLSYKFPASHLPTSSPPLAQPQQQPTVKFQTIPPPAKTFANTSPKYLPPVLREVAPKPPSSSSSISSLINSSSQTFSPPIPAATAQVVPPNPTKSVSPPSSALPLQGNFQTHKRSKSTPERNQPYDATKLVRGINIETGERNSNNAMIAAAALAAAADIPLPLKYLKSENLVHKESVPPVKEEDQLTEPEVDDNNSDDERTEDESNSKRAGPSAASVGFKLPHSHINPTGTIPPVSEIVPQKAVDEQKPPVVLQKPITLVVKPIEEAQVASTEPVVPAATPVVSKLEEPPIVNQEPKPEPEKEQEQKVEPIRKEPSPKPKEESRHVIPPLDAYKVDPDSGLIGCICGIEDDDGFTIQCDICYRWQHCLCMGFKTNEEVPEDEYTCYFCDVAKRGKFDPALCRAQTLLRLDLDKSTVEEKHERHQSNGTKRKVLNSEKSDKKRRLDIINDAKDIVSAPIVSKEVPVDILPNKDNELLKDGVTSESYQSVYFTIKTNDYKRPAIKDHLAEAGLSFKESYSKLSKIEQQKKNFNGIEIMTAGQYKSLKTSNVILPNHLKYTSENNKNGAKKNKINKTNIQVKPYSDNQKQKFNGISKLSLFVSSAEGIIPEDTPIIEYLGELDLFDNYVKDSINQYSTWGTTKPKVLKTSLNLGEKNLDVILDSRFVGNESRFIRKSCPSTANCKIRHIYIPETNSFKFLVVTSTPIELSSEEAEEELRLNWEWDPQHPILKMYKNNNTEKFDLLSNTDKSALVLCVDNLLHFTECGCSTSSNYSSCAIFKVKKATSYLLRSTRKASSISNINLTKSKEELIVPKKEKDYISWGERLLERDNMIRMRLSVTTEDADIIGGPQEVVDEDIEKPSLLFKIPFKQQLLSKKERILKERLSEHQPEKDNNAQEVPFLLVPNVMLGIEKSIEEELKPVVKDAETSILEKSEKIAEIADVIEEEIKAKVIASITAAVPESAVLTSAEVSQAPVKDVEIEVKKVDEVIAQPPKVVKKLSFADYKKKMK